MTTNLRVRTVPRLCELNPGICLTTEEKARKNLGQGSQRMLLKCKLIVHDARKTYGGLGGKLLARVPAL